MTPLVYENYPGNLLMVLDTALLYLTLIPIILVRIARE